MKNFYKNREKVKTLRTIYPKNQENLKNSKTRAHFTGSYIKECTSTEIRKPLLCNQGSTLSFWWRYLFFQSESPFVYQVINKTKLSITNFQKESPRSIRECEELWCNSVIVKEISLDTLWNLKDPQILFQNLLSKNYWWKNTLSLSKVLIYYEIETFTKKSFWSLKITWFFDLCTY